MEKSVHELRIELRANEKIAKQHNEMRIEVSHDATLISSVSTLIIGYHRKKADEANLRIKEIRGIIGPDPQLRPTHQLMNYSC